MPREERQASVRVVVVPRTSVDVELGAHLTAHRAVERRRLVLSERDVTLEPGVCDALRVVSICFSTIVVRMLLEQTGKVLY